MSVVNAAVRPTAAVYKHRHVFFTFASMCLLNSQFAQEEAEILSHSQLIFEQKLTHLHTIRYSIISQRQP